MLAHDEKSKFFIFHTEIAYHTVRNVVRFFLERFILIPENDEIPWGSCNQRKRRHFSVRCYIQIKDAIFKSIQIVSVAIPTGSAAIPTGKRHHFAPLRQPIPKLKRCAGQTVHLGILRGKENVEVRARMNSSSEEISLIPTLQTYSSIPLSHDDRGTVSLLGCQSLVIIANTSN